MGPHVTPSGSRLPTAWVGPGANARPVLQAALDWGLHGEGGSCHGGGHPLSPSPVRERLALGALLAVRTPVTSLGTRNSAVWVHRSVLRASLGWVPRRRMPEARTWGALREPGPTWHTCPPLAVSGCGQPRASAHCLPGQVEPQPCPTHPREATGAGASSGATKGSRRLKSLHRGRPWGRLPPPRNGCWLEAAGPALGPGSRPGLRPAHR